MELPFGENSPRQCASVLAVLLLLTACGRQEQKRIVIDDWYNVDFVKDRCSIPAFAVYFPNCADADPTFQVRGFEDRLRTAFASESKCHGITVVTYGGPRKAHTPARGRDDWSLMIDFAPGQQSQSWTLVGENPNYMTSDGTADQIATRVCTAVAHQGALIE
jgi:hypothetical protein